MEAHLDGVARMGIESLQHILPDKRAVHAKPHRPAARQQRPELRPRSRRKGSRAFPPWTVPDRSFTRNTCVLSATCAMNGWQLGTFL
jgi:hypothetical protein